MSKKFFEYEYAQQPSYVLLVVHQLWIAYDDRANDGMVPDMATRCGREILSGQSLAKSVDETMNGRPSIQSGKE